MKLSYDFCSFSFEVPFTPKHLFDKTLVLHLPLSYHKVDDDNLNHQSAALNSYRYVYIVRGNIPCTG